MEDQKDDLNKNLAGPVLNPEENSKIKIKRTIIILASVIAIVASIVIFFFSVIYFVPDIQDNLSGSRFRLDVVKDTIPDPDVKKQLTQIEKDIDKLSKKYGAYTPSLSYIVINTTENRFSLYKNKTLVRVGFCSSGSYTQLQSGDKNWIFKTPKGMYRIQNKTVNPVWKKPDWAFVELGLPIPSPNHDSRFEYGVLGDYSLSLGDGYLIHGTLYKRFLGMPVTHGCVRLNDEDLEAIYKTLNIGSKVYIF